MDWNIRQEYGEVYVMSMPDGTDIPWKPLSFGDFLYYTKAFQNQEVPDCILEDEIFRKCVRSPAVLFDLDHLKAGTVSVLSQQILALSGPSQVTQFNTDLESARQRTANIVNEIALLVIRGFPSYKPEEVFAMDYLTVMERLAQAESILLKSGSIKEPFSLYEEKPAPKRREAPANLKAAWEMNNSKAEEVALRNANSKSSDRKHAPPVEPVAHPTKEQLQAKHGKIDFDSDNQGLFMGGGMTGEEIQNEALIKHKALKLAQKVHKEFAKSK